MTQERTFMKIDLSDYDNRKEEITRDLMIACTEQGFFYVINHGIAVEEIRTMFQTSHDFFALPDEIKAKTPMDKTRNAGWEKLAQIRPSTGVADLKESIQLGWQNMDGLWPTQEDAPNFKTQSLHFMQQCQDVSMKILACLANGLGFEEDFFIFST